jgi:hypothetical protein
MEEVSMTIKQWLLSSLVASTCLVPIVAGAGPIENYSPVTADRLKNPEPGNWMLYRRTYDGQGYSPLDQINTSNVKDLTPVWTFSTGVIEGHEAPPIVNNGVMFVATPMGQVSTGATNANCPTTSSNCIQPAAGSDCGRTNCISPRPTITSWRSMPRPAKSFGTLRFRTTRRVST